MSVEGVSKESLVEVVLSIRRVSKVVEGGRIFSFSTHAVVGDQAGHVGCGKGKAREVSDARAKAVTQAKKRMVKVPLYRGRTIHHDVEGQCGSTKILLRRARPGTGIIAGVTARHILSSLGLRDIVAKSHGSSNVHTTLAAVMDALSKLNSPKVVAMRRGKHFSEIFGTSKQPTQ